MRSCQTTWDVVFEFVRKSDPMLLSLMQNFRDTFFPGSSLLVISGDMCDSIQAYYEEQVREDRFPGFLRDKLTVFLNRDLKQNFLNEASLVEAKRQLSAQGGVDSQSSLAQQTEYASSVEIPPSSHEGSEFFSPCHHTMKSSAELVSGSEEGLGDSRSSIVSNEGDLFDVYGEQLDELFSRNHEVDADDVVTDSDDVVTDPVSVSPLGQLSPLLGLTESKQQASGRASGKSLQDAPEIDSLLLSMDRCSLSPKPDGTLLAEPSYNENALFCTQGGECKIQVLHTQYCDSTEIVSLMASKTKAGQALQLLTCSEDVWNVAVKRLGPGGTLIYTAGAGPSNISGLKQYLAARNPQGRIFEKNVFTQLRENDLDEGIKQLLLNGIEGVLEEGDVDMGSRQFDDQSQVAAQQSCRFTPIPNIPKDTLNSHGGLEGSIEGNGGSMSLLSVCASTAQSSSKCSQAGPFFLRRADVSFESVDSPSSLSELRKYGCRPNLFGNH